MQEEFDEQPIDAAEAEVAAPSRRDALRSRTMELLDYGVIRQKVASYTAFFPARQLAFDMSPSYDPDEVELLQRETAEGRALLDASGEVNLHSPTDPSTSIKRAGLGGILTGKELLEIAESIEVQRRARSAATRARDRAPLLAEIAEGIPDLEELRRQVTRRIGMRGEVLDDATPTLRAIRRQVSRAYERVTSALTRIMQSDDVRETLQDQVISIRGDRLVLQVRADMRQRVPGIVHDASNTGATLFVEPFSTVELGNQWRELTLEEEREVRRVLRELSELVGSRASDIQRGAALTARLDFILARARYSSAIRGACALPSRAASDRTARLVNARHPMLGGDSVPINVSVGPGWSVLVITGPNTGGKTVSMKTVGLLALMSQSGLHVPALDGSALPIFDGVYADVGDQQSIEQSVSTFSSHMRNVIAILGEATSSSLVLLDELGTSTDPEEGAALAKAILDHLASRGVSTIATTHHRTVAAYAESHPGMMNASVQLNPRTLTPTYELIMGLPGRSYAMSIAAHLGLSEEIMEKAKSLLEPQHLRFEDWLNELQDQRTQLKERLQEVEESRAQITALRRRLEEELDYLASHREDILDSVRGALASQYEDVRRQLRRAEAALSWGAPASNRFDKLTTGIQEARAEVASVQTELATQQERPAPQPRRRMEQRPIQVGDEVDIRGLNLRGSVASLPEDRQHGEAEVRIGNVRMRINVNRLSQIEQEEEEEERPRQPAVSVQRERFEPATELDLRGLRAEEALMRLEEFLDRAVSDGFSAVRIIHGRGTGALRQAVRDHLARHPLAASFAPETRERGGDGATLVELA
ncbi:MAG: endonuclease MutS2 [Chloroflexi bacterium]|nr:endonuclease MutS2 [Chloroflexota bacterium]